jgi:hypothetical protein
MTIQDLRIVCICLSWLLAAAWLCVALLLPSLPTFDARGDDLVFLAIVISICLLIVGAGCMALAFEQVLRFRFAVIVSLAPLCHAIGAPLGFPLFVPAFAVPSILIFSWGVRELLWPQTIDQPYTILDPPTDPGSSNRG